MTNINYKIIYSLRVHLELQRRGFHYETEMKNPNHPNLNCWVYEETPALIEALVELSGSLRGGKRNG